jgi:hypothetical protein
MSTIEAIDSLGTAIRELQEGATIKDKGPRIDDVVTITADVIRRIMDRGSNKSGFGEWFHKNSLRYNSDRAIAHMTRAMQQIDGNVPSPDESGENHLDHLERALVRAAFTYYKAREGRTW